MNYNLSQFISQHKQKVSTLDALRKLLALIIEEKKTLYFAFTAILINSCINLLGPFLIGHAIDKYVQTKHYHGVLTYSAILLGLYGIGLGASYLQTKLMGGVG